MSHFITEYDFRTTLEESDALGMIAIVPKIKGGNLNTSTKIKLDLCPADNFTVGIDEIPIALLVRMPDKDAVVVLTGGLRLDRVLPVDTFVSPRALTALEGVEDGDYRLMFYHIYAVSLLPHVDVEIHLEDVQQLGDHAEVHFSLNVNGQRFNSKCSLNTIDDAFTQ